MGKAINLLFLILIAGSAVKNVAAQELQDGLDIVHPDARGCQQNTINIANLGALVQTRKEKAFVIAHLGTGETSSRLNRRRLNDIRTEFGINWDSDKIILAEGERVRGQGRIEFYLGSELMSLSLMGRNQDFCSLCCDRKKLFYQERYVWESGGKKQRQ